MGSQPSKPAQTKVFTPQTQIDFTNTLLAQLENSTETDYTRQQLANKYLEQRVSEKLSQLEEETLKKFEHNLNTSLLSDASTTDKNGLSSKALSQKVASLNERLSKLEERQRSNSSDKETNEVKSALTKCLLENKGKPLNCYEEVQKFKNLVLEH